MKRVLVVEDEASIREMVALNLRMNGMEAVEAESAEAALERNNALEAVPAMAEVGKPEQPPLRIPRFPTEPPALPLRVIIQRDQALPPLHRGVFDAAIAALGTILEIPGDSVRWLQRSAGLPQTGVIDHVTWEMLSRLYPAVLGDGT